MCYTILDLSCEALVDTCVDASLHRRDDWGTSHPYDSQKSLTLDSADAAWQLYEDGQTWQTYLLQKDNFRTCDTGRTGGGCQRTPG